MRCRWRQAALALLLTHLGTSSASKLDWTQKLKLDYREQTRALWNHGFDSYMHHAFPLDELRPLTCQGQGPDFLDPSNTGINDVTGNFSLTLIDSLSSLVILGNHTGFSKGVWDVVTTVHNFDLDVRPQVFEVTIRVLGGLLSAHIFAIDPAHGFQLEWYRGELLILAEDLGRRLLRAFATPTGIPFARVNLRYGVRNDESTESCSAGAASLLLEFATLSRLTSNTVYELAARKAFYAIWNRRSDIGLVGNAVNVISGAWVIPLTSSIGAGIDSFYEYALKAYILLGEAEFLDVWHEGYAAVMKHVRGREGFWFRTVWMESGQLAAVYVDSLSAFWPGLQVLAGDVQNAIKSHLVYYNLWRRYSGMPERFNIINKQAEIKGYPLRPEFIESTYFLYRATKDTFYLDVGARVLKDLQTRARVLCGLASISNVETGELQDRMESFALSETLKYLYLLFDEDHPFHKSTTPFVFTTEGHPLVLPPSLIRRASPVQRALREAEQQSCPAYMPPRINIYEDDPENYGLVGGIKDRIDVEFAKHLAGFRDSWADVYDAEGWCEVPKVEEYAFDFILSPDGLPRAEDLSPSSAKLTKIKEGYILNDVTGIRAHIVRRLDERGYDITKLGPHRILTGQVVYVNDSKILRPEAQASPTPGIVKLRFTLQIPSHDDSSVHSGSTQSQEWDTEGWPASFGPSVYTMTNDARIVLPKDEFGCEEVENRQTLLQSWGYGTRQTVVWLVKRGSCTFLEKLQRGQAAGARGVIVLSDEDEQITAALGDDETWEGEEDGTWLAVIAKQAGEPIWRFRKSSGMLRVSVKRDKPHLKENGSEATSPVRYLYVDGKPLLNTILLE